MLRTDDKIWVLIERIPGKQWVVNRWTVGRYEYGWEDYVDYLLENFNVEIYYKGWELQKRIDELEEQGMEVTISEQYSDTKK